MSFTGREDGKTRPDINDKELIETMVEMRGVPEIASIPGRQMYVLCDGRDYFVFSSSNEMELGKGTSGIIYKGWKMYLDQQGVSYLPCAIKVVHIMKEMKEEHQKEMIEEVKRESTNYKILFSEKWPDPFVLNNQIFFIQRLVKGSPLKNNKYDVFHPQLAELTLPQKLTLVIEILKTVKKLHDKDWVHGDINFFNILFSMNADGKIKTFLIDFANAQALGGKDQIEVKGMALGTRGFISPERERNIFSKGSDIFSLSPVVQLIFGAGFPAEKTKLAEHLFDHSDFPISKKTKEVIVLTVSMFLEKMSAKKLSERPTIDQAILFFEKFDKVCQNYLKKNSVIQQAGFWAKLKSDDFAIFQSAAAEEKFNLLSNKLS